MKDMKKQYTAPKITKLGGIGQVTQYEGSSDGSRSWSGGGRGGDWKWGGKKD